MTSEQNEINSSSELKWRQLSEEVRERAAWEHVLCTGSVSCWLSALSVPSPPHESITRMFSASAWVQVFLTHAQSEWHIFSQQTHIHNGHIENPSPFFLFCPSFPLSFTFSCIHSSPKSKLLTCYPFYLFYFNHYYIQLKISLEHVMAPKAFAGFTKWFHSIRRS